MIKFLATIFLIGCLAACSCNCYVKQNNSRDNYILHASGNEPFWSLDLNSGDEITFKTIDGYILSVPTIDAVIDNDSGIVIYNSETEKGLLRIKVYNKECIDNMSGKVFASKVEVELITKEGKKKFYQGCGSEIK